MDEDNLYILRLFLGIFLFKVILILKGGMIYEII